MRDAGYGARSGSGGHMARGTPLSSWLERCYGARDRLLASPRFQRWAASFPLTRPIARRRARALFDLCAGFVYSQVLLACVRLRLFEILQDGPQTIAELSHRMSLHPAAVERLLDAAVSLRLASRRGAGRFGLGPLGAALIGNPGLAQMIEHHPLLYADLHDPVALLRGEKADTALSGYWPYAGGDSPAALSAETVTAYTALMSASLPHIAEDVIDAYPLQRHACLLDVGGGDGTFLTTVAARVPELRVVLFDLPAVAERARERFVAAGIADRATAVGGSFLSDPLPKGADVVSLIRVVLDHDDKSVLTLLRAVRRALPDDGTLILAEAMSGTRGAEPIADAYFGFYLLAMGGGRARSPAELEVLLRNAGFGRVRMVPTARPFLARLMVAQP